jgi:hypothetical protein
MQLAARARRSSPISLSVRPARDAADHYNRRATLARDCSLRARKSFDWRNVAPFNRSDARDQRF